MNPATSSAADLTAQQIVVFGHSFNFVTLTLYAFILIILFLFWRIQRSNKLDFSDMITKNGKSVSLTKILQLIGGVSATWVIIKLTLANGLTESIFGLYLAYVGAVEGYSKYLAARYNYTEYSVKEPRKTAEQAAPKPDQSDLPEVR